MAAEITMLPSCCMPGAQKVLVTAPTKDEVLDAVLGLMGEYSYAEFLPAVLCSDNHYASFGRVSQLEVVVQ